MISISEALEIIKNNLPPRRTETVSLSDAVGRVSAEPVYSKIDSPPFDNSAMDGFAVRWEEVSKAASGEEIELKIAGESRAGIPYEGVIPAGCCIGINTGAVLHHDADTVVPVENCVVKNDSVRINFAKKKGWNVRIKGEEFRSGDLLIDEGRLINSSAAGLLAFTGTSVLKVYSRPRIKIITTGTELVPCETEPLPHQIRDSNSPMLSAAVMECGGILSGVYRLGDDRDLIAGTLEKNSEDTDIIIFSGGVSVGEHDHVKEATRKARFNELFWKVNQKPGKPLFTARRGNTLLFGLPGNPVSSYINFTHYIAPLIAYYANGHFEQKFINGIISGEVTNKGGRTEMLRVKINRPQDYPMTAEALIKQDSHMLSSAALADGYILLEAGQTIKNGTSVKIFLFPGGRDGIY